MEKSDNKLTTEEKGEIFEYVNNLYLKLKGQKKKQTKASFKNSWKEDNLLYIMMMKLNDVYDIWLKNEESEEWLDKKNTTESKGTIAMKKHMRIMNMMSEEERELELELEKIKEGKGYISEEQHKEEMEKQLQEQQEIIREQGDTIAKYRNEASMLREKLDAANKRTRDTRTHYEKLMKSLSTD